MRVRWFILTSLLVASTAFADGLKLGYVDLQRALNDSEAGKKAKDEFKVQVDKVQAGLKKKKDAIDALKEQLDKKALVMKDEERGNLEEDYRKKMRDFERDYKDSQTDLQQKDSELTGAIIKDLQEVIRDYGERENYTMIFEASSTAVLYGAKSSDLTASILEEYNRKHKK
ncbi:MAG: OmpH family outer membrane protein [Deltaproteobacteria bacterium]|nr:OmpH family outer membrane protein [Deltaproteobacteria bacterium]